MLFCNLTEQYTLTGFNSLESSANTTALLVQELVKAHGGTIMVDSQLNKGSTFTFTIPRYMGRDSEDSTRSKSLKAVTPGKTLQSFRQSDSDFNTIRKSKACSQVDFLKLFFVIR